MNEGARRAVFTVLLVLAALGAGGLMLSPLVGDDTWRAGVQVCGGVVAVVIGAVCAVLSWRWWGGFVGPWGAGGEAAARAERHRR